VVFHIGGAEPSASAASVSDNYINITVTVQIILLYYLLHYLLFLMYTVYFTKLSSVDTVIRRDLRVFSVRQEVRNYSVTYRHRLDDYPNRLANSLFQGPAPNRRP